MKKLCCVFVCVFVGVIVVLNNKEIYMVLCFRVYPTELAIGKMLV